MLVHYKGKRLVGLVALGHDKPLMPGLNEIPGDIVAKLVDHKVQGSKFDEDDITIIGKDDLGVKGLKKKGGQVTGIDLLLAAGDRAALDMAGKTVDLSILDRWVKKEKRPVVAKALRKQIGKIRNIKYRDKEDGKYEGSKGEGSED